MNFKSPLKYLLLSFFLLFLASVAPASEVLSGGKLPRTVEPILYDLSLSIDPDQEVFSGRAQIVLSIRKDVDTIWLHGKDLHVHNVTVELADGSRLTGKYDQVEEDGLSRISLPQSLAPQNVILEIAYSAPFNRKLEGLYRVEEDKTWYAFTQFEAISARLCFPGFDEPSFKTPFDITLTVKAEHKAITNTLPIDETPLEDGRKRIRFARTEKLPTYLIAFAVGPFDVVTGPEIPANETRSIPIPLRGVAVRGKGSKLQYALQNTGAILASLERYLGIEYPFGKLDLIAVPDFDYGAMENAGAITFRETLLLLEEEVASQQQKKSFAGVMAHELAHQWFGDLVTMAWWDDVWLNEGLSSWIDNRTVEEWDPSYLAMLSAIQSSLKIMDRDSTASARPVHRSVETSQDIISIADGIVFSKGAALPLMFERYLGEETFQAFIRHYLKKHQFSNATSEDFLVALEEIAGKEVSSALRSFLFQPGVPFVQLESTCEEGRNNVRTHHSRFTPLGSEFAEGASWQIPICIRFGKDEEVLRTCRIVSQDEDFLLSENGCADWIMPNADGTGYYRWTLSQQGWTDLRSKGKDRLTVQEELSVVDSIQSAFDAGLLPTKDALQALIPYASSDVRELAMAPAQLLVFVRENLTSGENRSAVERLGQSVYRPVYAKLGFDSESSDSGERKQFRNDVIKFLVFDSRDTEVRNEASKRGRRYIGFGEDGQLHPDAVDTNLVVASLGVAVQEAGDAYLDALIERLRKTNDSLLRSRILSAIGRVTGPEQVKRVLELSLDPSLRTNEVLSPVESLLEEEENREAVWIWVKENYDALIARLSPTDAGGIPYVGYYFCDEDKATDSKAFFSSRVEPLAGGVYNLKRVLDRIGICSAKVEAHRGDPLDLDGFFLP